MSEHIVYLVQKKNQRDSHDNSCAICKALRIIAIRAIIRGLNDQSS